MSTLEVPTRLSYPVVKQTQIVASICLESFFEFVKEFWHEVIAEDPIWNWHIPLMCNELQEAAERVLKGEKREYDLLFNVPPGTTKSTVASVMHTAWTLARDPSMRHITASHTEDLVLDHSRLSRILVQSERYRACFPKVRMSKDQNTKQYWKTTAGGGRKCCTVGGKTPTGFHAHFLTVDDPLDPMQAGKLTEVDINTANLFMSEVLPSRMVDKSVALTTLIMQRLHQNDPSGQWLKESSRPDSPQKIRHVCLPSVRCQHVHPRELRANYSNRLLDPIRLDEATLKVQEVKLGPFGYAAQYLQHPVPRGGGMYHVNKIKYGQPPADYRSVNSWLSLVRYWDKAGTSDGGAYTAGVLMGLDKPSVNGYDNIGKPIYSRLPNVWILHVVRGQWAASERESVIRKTAEMDGRHIRIGMEQEPGSAGKESVAASIKNLHGFKVKADRPSGDKVSRGDQIADQMAVGNIYCVADAPWLPDFIDELRFWPHSTHKDQGDAMNGAYNMLVKPKVVVGAMR
jgi:predicted phage terminase large subunit-like protein